MAEISPAGSGETGTGVAVLPGSTGGDCHAYDGNQSGFGHFDSLIEVNMKNIRVAAVQVESISGKIEYNLAHASPFVEQARRQGAEVVLLPELLPTGFDMTDAIWDAGEAAAGPTVKWLKEQSRKHGIWIGTSFLEAVEDRYFNTFVLMNPQGEEVARVRKEKPAATEAYFFEGAPGSHVADTPLGRIGVSICYEGTLASTIRRLYEEGADLVLMPHSAPTPTCKGVLKPRDIQEYNDAVRSISSATARELGVPAVMANKVGQWKTKSPWPFPDEDSSFPGYSSIADSDGKVLASLGDEEGVVVADIALDPARKATSPPEPRGKWARPVPSLFRLFAIAETLGRISYMLSLKRRRIARRISQAD